MKKIFGLVVSAAAALGFVLWTVANVIFLINNISGVGILWIAGVLGMSAFTIYGAVIAIIALVKAIKGDENAVSPRMAARYAHVAILAVMLYGIVIAADYMMAMMNYMMRCAANNTQPNESTIMNYAKAAALGIVIFVPSFISAILMHVAVGKKTGNVKKGCYIAGAIFYLIAFIYAMINKAFTYLGSLAMVANILLFVAMIAGLVYAYVAANAAPAEEPAEEQAPEAAE